MIDSDISHEEFFLKINEEQHYFRPKESIRAKEDQLGNIERDTLIEQGKRIEIDEMQRQNERQSLKLKFKE